MNDDAPPSVWSLETLWPLLWRERVGLLLAAVGVAVLVLLVNLLLPSWYRSTVKLLPEGDRPKLQVLSQVAEFARLAGAGGTQADPGRVYPVVLQSDGLLRAAVTTSFAVETTGEIAELCTILGMDGPVRERNIQDAVERLRDLLNVQYDARTGVITMTLEMREPRLAADILGVLVRELDVFMRQKRKTVAAEQRTWIEGRLGEVRKELRGAEEGLTRFREKNRRVTDSPELLLEQERLLRDVEMKAGILAELTRQHELARIEEIKNIGMVNVLDEARPSARRERPRRTANTIMAFVGTLLAGGVITGLRESRRRRAAA